MAIPCSFSGLLFSEGNEDVSLFVHGHYNQVCSMKSENSVSLQRHTRVKIHDSLLEMKDV